MNHINYMIYCLMILSKNDIAKIYDRRKASLFYHYPLLLYDLLYDLTFECLGFNPFQHSPMAGWPSPVRRPSKQSAGSGEAIHVSPVRVIHHRSRSREPSSDRELKIELPGTVGAALALTKSS